MEVEGSHRGLSRRFGFGCLEHALQSVPVLAEALGNEYHLHRQHAERLNPVPGWETLRIRIDGLVHDGQQEWNAT